MWLTSTNIIQCLIMMRRIDWPKRGLSCPWCTSCGGDGDGKNTNQTKVTRGGGIKRQPAIHVSDTSEDNNVQSIEDRQNYKRQGLLKVLYPELVW